LHQPQAAAREKSEMRELDDEGTTKPECTLVGAPNES
jgi:hypothetical protein